MYNKTNITIYTTSDFPYGSAPENFVRLMATGLVSSGSHVNIIRTYGRKYTFTNDTNIECTNLLFNTRPNHQFLKLIELFLIIFTIPISLILNKIRKKNNCVILYGLDYSYFILPFLVFSKILNYKLTRVITDFYKKKDYVPVWWKAPKSFFYNLQFKRYDKRLSGLVVLSNYLKNIALENNVSPNKILLIPNFINFSSLSNTKIEESFTKIGFFGTATIQRGFLDLLEAFSIVIRKYKNTILVVSGAVSGSISSEPIFKNVELKKNIYYTGFISQEELQLQQMSCNILVNPTKNTLESEAAFPTKIGEYFATKRPVVSTSVGDIKNYFESENQLILVEPNSPQALAEGILYLIENKQKAKEIGERGFNWAINNLDHKKNSEKLISFLHRI